MNNRRIISFSGKTNVYHRPGCKYVQMMRLQNQMEINRQAARAAGYCSCRCCNSMNYQYKCEQARIALYAEEKGMEIKYIDGIVYVKTEVGCWKLVYARSVEKIAVYHRNHTETPLDFSKPQDELYHRQSDIPYVKNICGCLEYIDKHDKYRAAEQNGQRITRFSKEKYKRAAEKRIRRTQQHRVDLLFRELEAKDREYIKLSFC